MSRQLIICTHVIYVLASVNLQVNNAALTTASLSPSLVLRLLCRTADKIIKLAAVPNCAITNGNEVEGLTLVTVMGNL